MGELRSEVRHILHEYLNNKLTDNEFKERVASILHEFENRIPKNLLYQDIGLIVHEREHGSSTMSDKFQAIWILLDQLEPRIKEALNHWQKAMSK